MLFAPELIASSRTMAIPAIYTNLLGLFLLISFSPVLALVSLACDLLAWACIPANRMSWVSEDPFSPAALSNS